MNSSSRTPRRKIESSVERASKMRLPVSKQDPRDAVDINRAINAHNAGKTGHEELSNNDLARFASPFGGARHPQLWSDYRLGKRRIPARDKMILAFCLATRPERIFRSWPKFSRLALLIDALSDHPSADELLLFSELLAQFATGTEEERARVVEKLRELKDR